MSEDAAAPTSGADGDQTAPNVCPDCAGEGTRDGDTCPTCQGSGRIEEPVGDA